MSAAPFVCPDCRVTCDFAQAIPYAQGVQNAYRIAWHCPGCGQDHFDVSLIGPLVPGPNDCLNCGSKTVGGQVTCPDCGLPASHAEAYLGLSAKALATPLASAREAFAQGLFRKGLAILNATLRDDYGLAEAWAVKFSFLNSLGYQDSAKEMLELALAKGAPEGIRRLLIQLYMEAGDIEKAEGEIKKYLAHPGHDRKEMAEEWSNLGLVLSAKGDTPEAEAAQRQALRLDPSAPLIYQNLCDVLIELGREDEALVECEAGLSHADDQEIRVSLLEMKAHLLASQDREFEALGTIREALALGASGPRAHFLHGCILLANGEFAGARNELLKVLDLDPEHDGALAAIEQIDDFIGV